MLRSNRSVAVILALAALLLAHHAVAAAADPPERIRTADRRLRELLHGGVARSPAMKDVASRLDRGAWVVFLLPGRCPDAAIVGCLLHTVTPFGGAPALRIVINPGNHRPNRVTAVIAHELMHALEVAESGEVVDNVTLRAFFQRLGRPTIAARRVTAYETVAAERLEARVFDELRASDSAAARARTKRR